jgi:hypothetical protein
LQNLESSRQGCRRRRQKDLIGLCEFVVCVRWFEVCKTSKLPERETVLFFSLVRKEPKVHQRFANLWTPGTIQIAGRYVIFSEMTGIHQVTGFAKSWNFAGYRRQ